VSIGVLFVTAHPFIGFISYVLSGLYWDWLFFTHDGYKDSEQAPKAYFEANGIAPQQIDELNTYLVKVRWGTFAASTSITAFCLLFFPDYAYQAIFVLTYIGFTLTSMIVGFSNGRIIWPYRTEGSIKGSSEGFPSMIVDRSITIPLLTTLWLTHFILQQLSQTLILTRISLGSFPII
jgi:hypothetical protein